MKADGNRLPPPRVELVVDEYSENLPGPALPPAVEAYLAQERSWHRLLRGTDAVSAVEARAELDRWMEP